MATGGNDPANAGRWFDRCTSGHFRWRPDLDRDEDPPALGVRSTLEVDNTLCNGPACDEREASAKATKKSTWRKRHQRCLFKLCHVCCKIHQKCIGQGCRQQSHSVQLTPKKNRFQAAVSRPFPPLPAADFTSSQSPIALELTPQALAPTLSTDAQESETAAVLPIVAPLTAPPPPPLTPPPLTPPPPPSPPRQSTSPLLSTTVPSLPNPFPVPVSSQSTAFCDDLDYPGTLETFDFDFDFNFDNTDFDYVKDKMYPDLESSLGAATSSMPSFDDEYTVSSSSSPWAASVSHTQLTQTQPPLTTSDDPRPSHTVHAGDRQVVGCTCTKKNVQKSFYRKQKAKPKP
ncbi:hypothetical protein OF83DRAFT_1179292 [Amylostereum chailletii]|nr:hypothetical protein OF83DRAFT_1179292 [Amylostereum chailletii]